MELNNRVVVITGAASGVGAACARRFTLEGAKVVLTDRAERALVALGQELNAPILAGDISQEAVVQSLAGLAREAYGRIDVWFSNAGAIGDIPSGVVPENDEWQSLWDLHVMSHVFAVRAVLPEMLERGEGYLLQTASGVALSLLLGKAHYSVTKTAALSFNEWLAANYTPKGVRVSCFCPGAIDTPMMRASGMPEDHPALRFAITADAAAEMLVQAIGAEKFLIDGTGPLDGASALTLKTQDYNAWFADIVAVQVH